AGGVALPRELRRRTLGRFDAHEQVRVGLAQARQLAFELLDAPRAVADLLAVLAQLRDALRELSLGELQVIVRGAQLLAQALHLARAVVDELLDLADAALELGLDAVEVGVSGALAL